MMTSDRKMTQTTLLDMLENNRDVDRAVTYIEGENAERRVSYGDVYSARRRDPAPPAGHGRAARRQDDHLPQQQRAVPRRHSGPRCAAASCRCRSPSASATNIATSCCAWRASSASRCCTRMRRVWSACRPRRNRSARRRCSPSSRRAASWSNRSPTSRGRARSTGPGPEDLAFIQFSSGSTSEPKGVMLTHGNLLANIAGATAVGKYNDQDVSLSWMPLTHDMGSDRLLPGPIRQSRARSHLMPTDLFVRRPLLWLQLASNKRVTLTCSPNFGYRHFLKVLGDRRLENVDLSCIRSIYNGAEPISVQLCNEFMQALAYTGLKHQRDVSGVWTGGSLSRGDVPGARRRLPLDSRQPAQARHRRRPSR